VRLVFTIDALDAAGNNAWRLLEDEKNWRACIFAEDARLGDAQLTDQHLIGDLAGRRLHKDRQHVLAVKARPGMFDFLMRGIFAHAVPHRLSPAPVPDKEQMLDIIRQAKPGIPWLLHLDLAGNFRMLDTSSKKIIGNLTIAVRGEIASSGGYVGAEAAEKESLMDEIYRQFLAGWLQHLHTRRLGVFVPDVKKLESEDALRQKIADWQHE